MRYNWKHQYDDTGLAERDRTATEIRNTLPTMTQAHFAKDADLNTIAKRYGITDGAIPPAALDPRFFGDYTDAVDFREHMDRIKNATDRFNALPAWIRSQFDNNMVALHDWVSNPANAAEAVQMGLLEQRSLTPDKPRDEKRDEPKPAAPPAVKPAVSPST